MTILEHCMDTDLEAMSTDLRVVPARCVAVEMNFGQAMLDDAKHNDQHIPRYWPSMPFTAVFEAEL